MYREFACPSSVWANTRRDPGFLLGWSSDSGYLCVSVRQFHVFVSCGDRVTIVEIPVCRIADQEVSLRESLRVDTAIALEVRFLKSATGLPSMCLTSYSVSLLAN